MLYTLGYGNRPPEEILGLVPGGALVVDVRGNPAGWCAEYSAAGLRERFGERYRPFGVLGGINDPVSVMDEASMRRRTLCRNVLLLVARWMERGEIVCLFGSARVAAGCPRRRVSETLAGMVDGVVVVDL